MQPRQAAGAHIPRQDAGSTSMRGPKLETLGAALCELQVGVR